MSGNWDYLIRDHMEFWKPYIPQCSEAIVIMYAVVI